MSEREAPQVFLKPIETFHCAPDDSEYLGERINRYFGETVDLLHYNDRAKSAFLNIDRKTLGIEDGIHLAPTDDFVRTLTARYQLIAFVLETRDSFNFIDVTMVCTLTPGLLSILQDPKELLAVDE